MADPKRPPLRRSAIPKRESTPQVSVIIIFYNAADYLDEAIRSVLAQDFDNFELLLVDDGSTDTSRHIAENYAEQDGGRVRYLRHAGGINRGMSASRNLGIQAAEGEFVAFIDADDRWHPSKLREQTELFQRYPQIDAAFGTVNYWASWDGGRDRRVRTGHLQNQPVRPPEAALALYPLGKAAAPCPSDLMVRRSAAIRLGGFEESFTGPLQMYEDQAFFAKLYLECTVFFDERCWLDYRQHDASCVASVSEAGYYNEVRLRFLLWFAEYIANRPEETDPRVKAALDRALFRSRHPVVARPLRIADRILRRRASL